MNNLANEKGSISYASDIGGQDHGTPPAVTLPVHAYLHNTAPKPRVIASAGPLGLFAVASTSFVTSMYDVRARSVTIPNAALGMTCFVGGFVLLIAGMLDFLNGNLFGGSAFTIYGGFWLAYTTFLYPGFDLPASYAAHPSQLPDATGIFFAPWVIITFIFLLASLRTNLAMVMVFFLLDMTFIMLMISQFTVSITMTKVAGGFGLATSAASFYLGTALLLDGDGFWFDLPIGTFKRRERLD